MIKFYISLILCMVFLLNSCSSQKKRLADRTPTDTLAIVKPTLEVSDVGKSYNNVNFQLYLFQNNISFYGANVTEQWKLFIKKDSSFTFELNGVKTVFEFSKAAQTQDADAAIVRYNSKKVIQPADTSQLKKNISIVITEEQNLEKSSTRYLPFTVVVTIEDKGTSTTYSGGGFYISNPALNDIWVLDSLNNQKVDTANFSQGLPRLEFHLDGGRINGFSGCNQFAGTYYIIRNEINFNPLISTMKFCIDTPGESSFLNFLNKNRFEYQINDLRLTLQNRDKTLAVFKKVD